MNGPHFHRMSKFCSLKDSALQELQHTCKEDGTLSQIIVRLRKKYSTFEKDNALLLQQTKRIYYTFVAFFMHTIYIYEARLYLCMFCVSSLFINPWCACAQQGYCSCHVCVYMCKCVCVCLFVVFCHHTHLDPDK